MNQDIPKVIDEINRRIEKADYDGNDDVYLALYDFYDWFVEEFVKE